MTTRRFGRYSVETSNESKVLFPSAGLTKGDLIDYYEKVADFMLPHLKDRPLTLHRFPDGIEADGFYQKNRSAHFPDWLESVTVKKEGGTVDHVLAKRAADLVYLANQGTITPHTWLSRVDHLNQPDRIIFDLDPSGDDFGVVRRGAQILRERLESLKLAPFVMTTGSRGLHVVTPIRPDADFDAVRAFARRVAGAMARDHADEFTVEHRKAKRGDRVFLDTNRNAWAQTGVAPYAVRAKPGAPVATPLEWEEVGRSRLRPDQFTIRNLFQRLDAIDGDPWRSINRRARKLPAERHWPGETD
ncbi:MAG: non-homologous end-joining DNA ligase [Phycisphaerales bacterium]